MHLSHFHKAVLYSACALYNLVMISWTLNKHLGVFRLFKSSFIQCWWWQWWWWWCEVMIPDHMVFAIIDPHGLVLQTRIYFFTDIKLDFLQTRIYFFAYIEIDCLQTRIYFLKDVEFFTNKNIFLYRCRN